MAYLKVSQCFTCQICGSCLDSGDLRWWAIAPSLKLSPVEIRGVQWSPSWSPASVGLSSTLLHPTSPSPCPVLCWIWNAIIRNVVMHFCIFVEKQARRWCQLQFLLKYSDDKDKVKDKDTRKMFPSYSTPFLVPTMRFHIWHLKTHFESKVTQLKKRKYIPYITRTWKTGQ